MHDYVVVDVDPQMLKGVVALLLLAAIAKEEDYGYSLVERLRAAGLGDLAEGTVYPALARLERAGFVDTFHVPSDRGPARKYYRVSAAGRVDLATRLESWRRLTTIVARATEGVS